MANHNYSAEPLRPELLEQAVSPRYEGHHITVDSVDDLQAAYDNSDSELSATTKLPLLALTIPAAVAIAVGVGFSFGFWFITRSPAALTTGVVGSLLIPLCALAAIEGTLPHWAMTKFRGR